MVLGNAITQFNNVKSIKYWQYCDGSPQTVCIIDSKNNTFDEFILGDPIIHAALSKKLNKKIYQIIAVLPTQWIGSRLIDQNSFSLITCTMTSGFDMRDFKVITIEEAKKLFPNLSDKITMVFS